MAKSKYEIIVKSMQEKIRRGEYPPGSKLPGYLTLAREYNVSAITSNRALIELERLGLVQRRERFGTFVLERPRMLREVFVVVEYPVRLDNVQFFDYWRGLITQAEAAGVSTQTIQVSDPKFEEKTSLDCYAGQGLVFLGPVSDYPAKAAEAAEIPYVFLGNHPPYSEYSVMEDRVRTGCELVKTMIRDGYRKIGFIGNLMAINHRQARDGYLEGVKELDLGYRYIRDADNQNIVAVTQDLLAEDLGLDALIVMGGSLPIAALTVILDCPRKPALGVLSENSNIFQLNHIAYIGSYSQIESGKMAFDLLTEISTGQITPPIVRHPPFRILRPGEQTAD